MTRRPIDPSVQASADRDHEDSPSPELLKDAFSLWCGGVSVLALRVGERMQGLTISAFAPLSLDPPLLLLCIHVDAPILTYVREARRFTVNILAADQKRVAGVFSDRFPVPVEGFPPEGDAVLDGALASLTCDLHEEHPGGDHAIVIGRIRDVRVSPDAPPLLHFRRGYRSLPG